jgi:hypothetical protein
MRFSRTSIAAALTIVALGALAAVALASGGSGTTTAPAPTAETDPPAQVRTETIHRTVHRSAAPARAASSDDDGTLDQGPGDAPRTPVAPAQADDRGHDFDDDRRGDDDDDHDNSGPGSSHSGHGGGDDDHGGHGGDDD